MEKKTTKPALPAGRYLKYAIGEIVLVVIGILIALQINNWNENRKSQINQEKYLVLLKKEALSNLENAKHAKTELKKRMNAQLEIIKLIDSGQDTITDKTISKLFAPVLFSFTRFQFENSVLTEFKNSGELKNILNDSIRSKLVKLEPLVNELRSQEANIKSDYENTREILVNNGSTRKVYDDYNWKTLSSMTKSPNISSNKSVLRLTIFENRLMDYIGTTFNIYNSHYPKLENHLNELIVLMDEELDIYKR